MSELVYKSTWCKAEPIVYEKDEDPVVERFIGKIFANKVNRLIVKNSKFYYQPSQSYFEYLAKHRKIS